MNHVLSTGPVIRCPTPLLDRARGAAEAGYKEISTFMGDLFELEARGGSLADLRRELDGIGVTLNATDPLLDWYPSYNPGISYRRSGQIRRPTPCCHHGRCHPLDERTRRRIRITGGAVPRSRRPA